MGVYKLMIDSFYKEHLVRMKKYDKENNKKFSVTKPYHFGVAMVTFLILYIIFLRILVFSNNQLHLKISFGLVILSGIVSIVVLYFYKERKDNFLIEKKKYFAKIYSENMIISLKDSCIKIFDHEEDKEKNKDFIAITDKEIKELSSIVSNYAISNKYNFKANFSILTLLLAFGISLINLSFSQPSNLALNSINSSVIELKNEIDISPKNKDNIQKAVNDLKNTVTNFSSDPFNLINLSVNNLKVEDNIKDSVDDLEAIIDEVKNEKHSQFFTIILYGITIFIFYLIMVFTAIYLEKILNIKSTRLRFLTNILSESHILSLSQENLKNFVVNKSKKNYNPFNYKKYKR